MELMTNDGQIRLFECPVEDGGCGNITLIANINYADNTVTVRCSTCGFEMTHKAPMALTNPNGSASFVGMIPGGWAL